MPTRTQTREDKQSERARYLRHLPAGNHIGLCPKRLDRDMLLELCRLRTSARKAYEGLVNGHVKEIPTKSGEVLFFLVNHTFEHLILRIIPEEVKKLAWNDRRLIDWLSKTHGAKVSHCFNRLCPDRNRALPIIMRRVWHGPGVFRQTFHLMCTHKSCLYAADIPHCGPDIIHHDAGLFN